MQSLKFIALSSLIVIGLSFIEALAEDGPRYVLCRNGGMVRTIRIVQKPQGCVVIYTKSGTDRVVGSGQYLLSCSGVLNNIKTNLEKAWWKCRDISQSEVVQSYELGEVRDEAESAKKP